MDPPGDHEPDDPDATGERQQKTTESNTGGANPAETGALFGGLTATNQHKAPMLGRAARLLVLAV